MSRVRLGTRPQSEVTTAIPSEKPGRRWADALRLNLLGAAPCTALELAAAAGFFVALAFAVFGVYVARAGLSFDDWTLAYDVDRLVDSRGFIGAFRETPVGRDSHRQHGGPPRRGCLLPHSLFGVRSFRRTAPCGGNRPRRAGRIPLLCRASAASYGTSARCSHRVARVAVPRLGLDHTLGYWVNRARGDCPLSCRHAVQPSRSALAWPLSTRFPRAGDRPVCGEHPSVPDRHALHLPVGLRLPICRRLVASCHGSVGRCRRRRVACVGVREGKSGSQRRIALGELTYTPEISQVQHVNCLRRSASRMGSSVCQRLRRSDCCSCAVLLPSILPVG